jgi:hypothetical protein
MVPTVLISARLLHRMAVFLISYRAGRGPESLQCPHGQVFGDATAEGLLYRLITTSCSGSEFQKEFVREPWVQVN